MDNKIPVKIKIIKLSAKEYMLTVDGTNIEIHSSKGYMMFKKAVAELGITLCDMHDIPFIQKSNYKIAIIPTVANRTKFEEYYDKHCTNVKQNINGITVETLYKLCQQEIKKGNGKKVVLISQDDECNGFHTLWEGFVSDTKEVNDMARFCGFHNNNNPNSVVLLY